MKDKRLLIIDTAMKCFARKGFHATSIQEIADELGIAKGSLYFYFKSKEDLLLSGFKHYYELMIRKIQTVNEDSSLSPKVRLTRQMEIQFLQFMEYRDFFSMLLNEQNVQINDDMKSFIFTVRAQSLFWYHTSIIEIYGKKAEPYALDGASIITAMTTEYMNYMIWDVKPFDYRELSVFLIQRMDDLMNGMMRRKDQPILSESNMKDFINKGTAQLVKRGFDIKEIIPNIRTSIQQFDLSQERKEEMLSSLRVLEEEISKEEPQMIIIKGMISYLRNLKINELNKDLEELEKSVFPSKKA